ncbi:putative Dual specificity protein phosphatase 19 [Monocercomonoides exilis]|uniref:putative Dual specificity protein phosphatase 19 n=1 Tax=Monocercomonoides exilis TaxID=2049356 RepID=UPI00355A8A5F|nr:putative Dual specificity protein phosphatase 19 [Monocercomonoides exilis]|eukprot:MONOS_12144.1-p1 / transcript=MONOS_12144.1 / gene=MONOS_12144 / organism=Monocercomonoides_exilis_PA203 / gene_product=Dual specificity protein phosphatase 19 / transcript_product=Dual specificity protein phosphatase 19 / location=Mono_scaffold00652:6821-7690(-) / protein_length=289 / sequence_SO=supercontig / SO=protein_coding / is_pseudo=false
MFKELIAVQYCFILDETYCNFNKVYPFICTSPFSITSPEIRPYLCPCEIVHNLFLGHYPKLDSIEFLTQLGITHVLNISLENDYTLPEGVSRKFICVDDIESVELDFDDGVQFISRSLDKGGRVLVHCYLGISRSSSMIIAYLMWRYNIPLSKALVFVKNRRRIIRPNDGFLEQLIEYEAKLKESRKVCQVEESRKEDCEDQKKVCREDCNFDEGHKANDEMSCSSSSTPSETVSKGSTEEEEEEEVNFDEIPFPPNKEETECLLETVRKLQVKRGKGKMNSFENCVIF